MENENTDSGTLDSLTNTDNIASEPEKNNSVQEETTAAVVELASLTSNAERHNNGDKAGGKDRDKINILLKPVGDAPILKNKLWAVPSERQVSQITEFVKKYLKLEKHQNLFFFVNQLFAPAPDQSLRDLYECFGSDGKLVLHYSTTIAWG